MGAFYLPYRLGSAWTQLFALVDLLRTFTMALFVGLLQRAARGQTLVLVLCQASFLFVLWLKRPYRSVLEGNLVLATELAKVHQKHVVIVLRSLVRLHLICKVAQLLLELPHTLDWSCHCGVVSSNVQARVTMRQFRASSRFSRLPLQHHVLWLQFTVLCFLSLAASSADAGEASGVICLVLSIVVMLGYLVLGLHRITLFCCGRYGAPRIRSRGITATQSTVQDFFGSEARRQLEPRALSTVTNPNGCMQDYDTLYIAKERNSTVTG